MASTPLKYKNAELISHVIDSAEQCRESFTTINGKVQMVNQMSKEITTATFEQFRGVEESNKAISLINEMAQKNTCQNDNVIQSINELKNQSELTHSIIQRISRLMKNKNSPPPAGEDPSNSIPLAKNEFSKKYKVAS